MLGVNREFMIVFHLSAFFWFIKATKDTLKLKSIKNILFVTKIFFDYA